MPRRSTPEVAHTVYTDHRIANPRSNEPAILESTHSLQAWREPERKDRERNLGLAYIYVGQKESSAELVRRGFAMLMEVTDKDAEVLSALGLVLLQKRRPEEARHMFAEASRLQPANADHVHNLAISLHSAGDTRAAIRELERAIALNPLSQQSWLFLAQIYRQSGNHDRWRETLERYLKYVPQNLSVRAAIRR
jgi:Tfp pilus assembly protein PilF